GRNGREAHRTFCRSVPTGLAGQRVHAHSLAGCAGRRASSAYSELKLSSAARADWECGRSGSRPRVRTDSITSSAPSAASATMEMARVQTILGQDWNRRFNCVDDADDTDAKELNPSGLWIRDCVYRACYCLPSLGDGIRNRPAVSQARSALLPGCRGITAKQEINQCCVGVLRFSQRGSSGWPKSMRTSPASSPPLMPSPILMLNPACP